MWGASCVEAEKLGAKDRVTPGTSGGLRRGRAALSGSDAPVHRPEAASRKSPALGILVRFPKSSEVEVARYRR